MSVTRGPILFTKFTNNPSVWWNIHKIHQLSSCLVKYSQNSPTIHLFGEMFTINLSCWWNIHKVHQCSANLVKLQGICQINYYLPSKANTIVYIHLINLMEFKWLHSALIYHMLILNEVVNHISSNHINITVYIYTKQGWHLYPKTLFWKAAIILICWCMVETGENKWGICISGHLTPRPSTIAVRRISFWTDFVFQI